MRAFAAFAVVFLFAVAPSAQPVQDLAPPADAVEAPAIVESEVSVDEAPALVPAVDLSEFVDAPGDDAMPVLDLSVEQEVAQQQVFETVAYVGSVVLTVAALGVVAYMFM
ncbi:MAG: hypothetical protein AAGK21_05635 [Bacteroidota bacterium]